MTTGNIGQGLLGAQHQVTLYEVSHSILETEIRIIETALGGKRRESVRVRGNFFLFTYPFQAMRVPRDPIHSRVPLSQYPRSVDTVLCVGCRSTFCGLTKAVCQTSIWGLSKQGKTCRACGLSVHSKCELKVRFS